MYYLVCYCTDFTYDICCETNIRKRRFDICEVKYKRRWYKARILLNDESRNTIETILEQLTGNVYVIVEPKLDSSLYEEDVIQRTVINKSDYIEEPSINIEIHEDVDLHSLLNETIYIETDKSNENDLFQNNEKDDPDYIPEDELDMEYTLEGETDKTNPSFNNLVICQNITNREYTINHNFEPEVPSIDLLNLPPTQGPLDIKNVDPSNFCEAKRNFCFYCKKFVIKIARHLQCVHKNEELVRKFSSLPKKCPERLKMIDTLRRSGNFLYNTNNSYNKGDLIVCRRPTLMKGRNVEHYETCHHCKGFFSKLTIKRHVDRCIGTHKPGERSVMMMGRKIRGEIHPLASDVLKNEIFPVLNADSIVKCVRYDELVILYCNQLCLKYRFQHNHKQIRSFIRLIGRFLLALKKRKDINCLKEVFHPQNYNLMIESVNEIAKLKKGGHYYGAPSVASNMGTHLKKIGKFLIAECIKSGDETVKKRTEDFLHLIQVSYSADVNRTALETQWELTRHKKIELPIQEDIRKFYVFITKHRMKYEKLLSEEFDTTTWMELAKFTLLTLHIFNARRAGEIERMLISDFDNISTVDKDMDKEILKSLSIGGQKAAEAYSRIEIRGKLGRTVPVLLHKDHMSCIKLILLYRKASGVPDENPFLFGLSSYKDGRHRWLSACNLMRKYAEECGALRPDLLRGTKLRKHLATQSIFLNLQEQDVSDLAQFMGHADKIHRSHYRLPVPVREISKISMLLENAVGIEKKDDGSITESSDDENNNSVQIEERIELQEKSLEASPVGYVKRRSWSNCETEAVINIFSNHIENQTLPSLGECSEAIMQNTVLQTRSPTQLKVHIKNIRNRIDKGKKCVKYPNENVQGVVKKRKSVKKVIWSTPEKRAIEWLSAYHAKRKTLPSLAQCKKLILENPVLQNRTPILIKAKINNDIKKM